MINAGRRIAKSGGGPPPSLSSPSRVSPAPRPLGQPRRGHQVVARARRVALITCARTSAFDVITSSPFLSPMTRIVISFRATAPPAAPAGSALEFQASRLPLDARSRQPIDQHGRGDHGD